MGSLQQICRRRAQLAHPLPKWRRLRYNQARCEPESVITYHYPSFHAPTMPIVTLSEMSPGQEADLFLLMTAKEELKTKTGKPYFRVGFRDGSREVSFPIWGDSPWAVDCRDRWTPGVFYKLRAVYQETNFGPQLEIRKIREVVEADAADGFDPTLCLPRSRFDPQQMFDELLDHRQAAASATPLCASWSNRC